MSYAIGKARAGLDRQIETFGTGRLPDDEILRLIKSHFDLRPAAIIESMAQAADLPAPPRAAILDATTSTRGATDEAEEPPEQPSQLVGSATGNQCARSRSLDSDQLSSSFLVQHDRIAAVRLWSSTTVIVDRYPVSVGDPLTIGFIDDDDHRMGGVQLITEDCTQADDRVDARGDNRHGRRSVRNRLQKHATPRT